MKSVSRFFVVLILIIQGAAAWTAGNDPGQTDSSQWHIKDIYKYLGAMGDELSPEEAGKFYNAQKYLQQVKCPVLAINGEKDRQVIADENLEAIRKALIRTMKPPGRV